MDKKVIVIGAGFGGLGSAILLARAGYDVTVVEKNDKVGGRANLLEKDGYRRDMGPSRYLMPDAFDRYFTAIDRKVSDYLDLQKLEPSYRVFFKDPSSASSGGTKDPVTSSNEDGYDRLDSSLHSEGQAAKYLDLYADVDKAATTFDGIESGSGDKLKAYLKSAAYQYGIAMEKFVFKNFDSIRDFMTPQLAIEGMQLNVFTKLYNYVSRYVKNENLKKLLMYPSVFLGTSPYETPALFNIMSHVDFNQGVFYPQGGIHQIPQALYQIALEEGVKFEFNAEVEKIVVEDKKVTGVILKNIIGDYDLSAQYNSKNPHQNNELFIKLKKFVDQTFEGKTLQQKHFQRVIDRVLYQNPNANFAIILAAYGHDIERGFRDESHKVPESYIDPVFLKHHQEGGATIIRDFLLKNGADQQLADKVRHLISKHEEGGDTEQDILRDADSASYFETSIKTFIHRVQQGIGTQESIIDKINWMYQRIGSLQIKDIIKGNYEKSIGEIKQSKNNQVSADIIISNADMRHTETQLLEVSQQTYPASYWDKQVISPSGFILYLGVDGELPQLKHHTLVFSDDWRGGFDQIFADPQRPQDPNYYICNPSKTDPTVAPAGKENLFVLVPIAPGLDSTPESLEAYRDHIIADISHNCGIPDLADRIEVSQIFSIPQFEQYYNAYKGTALGLAHTFFQSAVRRPQNYSKKVKGLYYAGGYTTPGIGMPMCLISAMMVADRVEKDK